MEETNPVQELSRIHPLFLPPSSNSIFERFEQDLKDELARRAVKDQVVLAELQIIRQASLNHQILPRQDAGILGVFEPQDQDDLVHRSSSQAAETNEHVWHERYRKLSKRHHKLLLERDQYRDAFNKLKGQRRKDEEIMRQWSEWEGQTSKRRSKSKDSERVPRDPRSSSLIPQNENRLSLLSQIALPLEIAKNISTRETIPSDPPGLIGDADSPTLFDQWNDEASIHSGLTLGQPYSTKFQGGYSNDDDDPGELPPVTKSRSTHVGPRQVVDFNWTSSRLTAEDDKENREPPSLLSTASQSSTQDAPDENTTLIGIGSNSPIVISAGPVKKRRRGNSSGTQRGQVKSSSGRGNAGDPQQVKSEHGSSSPLMAMRQLAGRNNSQALDLDDVPDKIPTPKKIKRLLPQSDYRHSTSRKLKHDPSRAASEPMDTVASQARDKGGQPRPFSENASERRSMTPNISIGVDEGFSRELKRQIQNDLSTPVSAGITSSVLYPEAKIRNLYARSPNLRANRMAKRERLDPSRGIAAISTISEDGDIPSEFDVMTTHQIMILDPSISKATGAMNDERECLKNKATEKFMDLFENPNPARGLLSPLVSKASLLGNLSTARAQNLADSRTKPIAAPTQLGSNGGRLSKTFPELSKSPIIPSSSIHAFASSSNGSKRHSRNFSSGFRSTVRPAAFKAPHEPIRDLPIHLLTREHFRINPECNKGMSYAFNEVVRGKEDRTCLPGCTRPACCGAHFRRLIESGLEVHPDESLWAPGGEDEGIRLVMEFMRWGRERVQKIGEDEMKRLLIEAKIQKAANLFGKHRHVHDRAPSPPGFWDTDFPSTQEMARNRELANEMERERIEVRRTEAMKTRGLWRFADE